MSIHTFPPTNENADRSRLPPQTRYRDSVYNGVVVLSAEYKRQKDIEELVERIPEHLLSRLLQATDDELWVLYAFAEGLYMLRVRDRGIEGCIAPTEEFGAVHAATAAVTKRLRPPRVDDRTPLPNPLVSSKRQRSRRATKKGGTYFTPKGA